jgi:hypothetical protein
MKQTKQHSRLIQQRITVMMALLFCMLISGVEYMPLNESSAKSEKQNNPNSQDQNQTFFDVAVDAVVPFVVHVSHSTLYFIYEIVRFKGTSLITETTSIFQSNQLVEILFERIISTKGP